jgi:predicted Holliday junction resolvase-like endonuclease
MKQLLLIFFLILIITESKTEILIFKDCRNKNYNYEKNKYTLDLDKGIMTREFIYDDNNYQRLRLNDINEKKENITNKGIAKDDDLIVSEISGYLAF